MNYSLYFIADTTICEPERLMAIIEKIKTIGVTCVQLRMKNMLKNDMLILSQRIDVLLKRQNIPLIINDHLAIAKTIDAAGIHLGQKDITYDIARKQLGENKIIGLSIENMEQAKAHKNANVDYFGVGPVFATTTKLDAVPPIGLKTLTEIKQLLKKPVIAIGGINSTNAADVYKTGADGIAMASAIISRHSRESGNPGTLCVPRAIGALDIPRRRKMTKNFLAIQYSLEKL